MKAPLVSFCFTTYKRPEYLKKTLRSILVQTFQDFEIIISDNDSEGASRAVVAELGDDRIKYFINAENLGMIKSFNKSIERSSGEYIVMIADDDPVYPDMLQVLNDLKNKYPGYGMYMGGCDWFCEDKQVAVMNNMRVGTNSCLSTDHNLNEILVFTPADFIIALFNFKIFGHFLWSTCMVKRDLLVRMGGVPDYGTPFLGDFAYMSIASADNGCVVINRSLGCQTMHTQNFGRNQDEQLPVLARELPKFLDERLSGIQGWPEVKKVITDFMGLWMTGHMAFLYKYKRQNNLPYETLLAAEKEVFDLPYMKKYRFKYYMKKKFPVLHNMMVSIKKKIS